MMADEFTCFWSQFQNYIAEADADAISAPGQLEITWQMQMWCLAVSMLMAEIHSCRSNWGNGGGIRITLQMQTQIQFPKN